MENSIRKDITNKKGDVYNVKVVFDETRTMLDYNLTYDGQKSSCCCRFMSFDFWSKRFQELGTICRHILQICAEEKIKLPEKYQTERNIRVMQTFIK